MCFEHNYGQAHYFFIGIACNDRVCFLNTLIYINVAYCITKIEILTIFKNSITFLPIRVMPILLRCMPSFPICFFESRDFCRINLIVSSSLQKFSTMLFTLDPLSASLSLRRMMLEITTSFVWLIWRSLPAQSFTRLCRNIYFCFFYCYFLIHYFKERKDLFMILFLNPFLLLVIDLHLHLKCHSFASVFQTFC